MSFGTIAAIAGPISAIVIGLLIWGLRSYINLAASVEQKDKQIAAKEETVQRVINDAKQVKQTHEDISNMSDDAVLAELRRIAKEPGTER